MELAEARRVSTTDTLELHGTTRASERATLAFAVGGRLHERAVDVGDRVRAGQVLARLDASGYANGVAAAEATVRELRARREQLGRDEARVATLREGGVVGDAELEEVRTGVLRVDESLDAAEVAVREARRQRGEATLRAPFDGVVRAVFADEGAVVGPGAPLLLLSGDGRTEIALDLPERAARWAVVGSSVEVRLPTSDERYVGTLVAAADAAGPNGLFPARVALPADVELASGRGAMVRLRSNEPLDELRVPVRAIVDPSGDRPFVWHVDADGVARRVEVRLGALRDAPAPNDENDENDESDAISRRVVEAEITLLEPSPIAAGSRVVVAGHRRILEGDRVVVARPEVSSPDVSAAGATNDERPAPRATEAAR